MIGNDRLEKILEDAGVEPRQIDEVLAEYTAAVTRMEAARPKIDVTVSSITEKGDTIKVQISCPNTDQNYFALRRIKDGCSLVMNQPDFLTIGEAKKKDDKQAELQLVNPESETPEAKADGPYSGPIAGPRGGLLPEAEGAERVIYNGLDMEYQDEETGMVTYFAKGSQWIVANLDKKDFIVQSAAEGDRPLDVAIQKTDWKNFNVVPKEAENQGDDQESPLEEEIPEADPNPEPPTAEKEPPSYNAEPGAVYDIKNRKLEVSEGVFNPYTKFRVVELKPPTQIMIREIPDLSTGEPITQGNGEPFVISVELFDELFVGQ